MVKQSIWIGITIVVFFVGIGISYAVFSSTYDPNTMGQGIIPEKEPVISHPEKMTSAAPLPDTAKGPQIDYSKGYFVEEIRDGLYWVFCYGICLEQEPKNILRIKCS